MCQCRKQCKCPDLYAPWGFERQIQSALYNLEVRESKGSSIIQHWLSYIQTAPSPLPELFVVHQQSHCTYHNYHQHMEEGGHQSMLPHLWTQLKGGCPVIHPVRDRGGGSEDVAICSQRSERATCNNDIQRGDSMQTTTRSKTWLLGAHCLIPDKLVMQMSYGGICYQL